MEVGIVGLPGSGKTMLFNALTGAKAEGFSGKSHLGMAEIPDPRVELIASYIKPKKLTHATLQLVDIPGVPAGSDAKKINAMLEQIRQVDAICHVVRCFDDGGGRINPRGDIDSMQSELVLADFVVAESARERAAKVARSGEKDAKERLAVLERAAPILEDGTPLNAINEWSEPDEAVLRSYGFVTAKPMLYVANVSEDDLAGDSEHAKAVFEHAGSVGSTAVAVCAELEAELAELDEPDRGEMLESLGLAEPAIGPLARAANQVLGLMTFYTAGDKEVRAWSVHKGATAPEAAGAIHSDLQRGFIRAETYHVEDLVEHGSEKAIKEAGRMRSEGKGYQIHEGDVLHILFNV